MTKKYQNVEEDLELIQLLLGFEHFQKLKSALQVLLSQVENLFLKNSLIP